MNIQNNILTTIPVSDLQELITLAVRNELANVQLNNSPETVEFLTRKQTALKLQISLPTLHAWTKDGLIQGYRISGRVRYKSIEVESALKAMQTKTKRG